MDKGSALKQSTRFLLYIIVIFCFTIIWTKDAHAADNLIPNPSVETIDSDPTTPTDWHRGYLWGDLDAQYQYANSGYQSNHSLKVTISRLNSGDAKWYFTPQLVKPGQSYQFSDYYQSNIASTVVVMVTKADQSVNYVGLKNAGPTTTWTRYSDSFTTPTDAQSVTIFHLIAGVGYLSTDNFSLIATSSTFNRGLVSLTFDDSWQSIYQNGLPLLARYDIKSTQYIVTGFIGRPEYMTLNQVRAFAQAGHEIGSHSVHHYDLTNLSLRDLINELSKSKSYLEKNIGQSVSDFAAPYGAYDDKTISQIRKYYRSQRTSDVGFNAKTNFDTYNIRAQYVTPQTTIGQYQDWLATALSRKAWLVIMYHQVDTSGSDYSVTPAMLEYQLQALQASGLISVTVNQALNEIQTQL